MGRAVRLNRPGLARRRQPERTRRRPPGPARRRVSVVLALAAAAALPACAYFNALYNAQREFEEAERLTERGESGRAGQAYLRSAQKAAKSFEQDPEGRWADDALYLLGRAHFHRGSYPEARASLTRLLTLTEDADVRAGARTFLGAAELRLGNLPAAREHLAAVLSAADLGDDTRGQALLWRGRLHFAAGDADAAWADLADAARAGGGAERAARMEAVRTAVLSGHQERAGTAAADLVSAGYADLLADSVFALADTAVVLWGADLAGALLAPLDAAAWPDDRRAALYLTRADLALAAGDTAVALAHARDAASRSAGPRAIQARVRLARWTLATSSDLDDLREVRAALLPALADDAARGLVRLVEIVGILVETGLGNNQPLALFTAAEVARDELEAPGIARAIFLGQAEGNPRSPWAMKAALAAAQLNPSPAERTRIEALLAGATDDPYVTAARGRPSARYGELETQLDRMVSGLRRWGREEAERRDGLVLQTVLTMDSLRLAAELDSLTVACGLRLDSLGVEEGLLADSLAVGAGLLADSALAACVRRDTLRFDSIVSGALDFTPDSAAADSLPDPAADTASGADSGQVGRADDGTEPARVAAAFRMAGLRPAR